jgi:hypothetical protein
MQQNSEKQTQLQVRQAQMLRLNELAKVSRPQVALTG